MRDHRLVLAEAARDTIARLEGIKLEIDAAGEKLAALAAAAPDLADDEAIRIAWRAWQLARAQLADLPLHDLKDMFDDMAAELAELEPVLGDDVVAAIEAEAAFAAEAAEDAAINAAVGEAEEIGGQAETSPKAAA